MSALELGADQEARSRILARTAALLEAATGDRDPAVVTDSAAYWIAALLDDRFYTPSESALQDLIAGELRLIRSAGLRRAILAYTQERDRLRVVEELEPMNREVLRGLLEDSEFRSLAYLRWQRIELTHRFAAGLGSRLERLSALLEEEPRGD